MQDPAVQLLIFTLFVLSGAVLFWPQRGLVWRWGRRLRFREKTRIEDALKYLYDCEYRGQPATLQNLSGSLEISGNDATRLVAHLEALALLDSSKGTIQLTNGGRRYALRVIRVHRLWERYLADRTGVSEADWHEIADRKEHRMSSAEAEALSDLLGNPRYDPHGDPIPTASGDITPIRGQPLSDLAPGDSAAVVHVEDEPYAVYTQIVAAGISPGMRVQILSASPDRIALVADGEERVLAPVVAAHISVVKLPEGKSLRSVPDLADLRPGERGQVVAISPACRGPERRRLMDLGLVPGTLVEAEFTSPTGDPTAYRVRGSVIALRKEQAEAVYVKPESR